MKNWYKVVLHDARKREVPTIFVRYEDLCNGPEEQLRNIMRYVIGLDNLQGTNAERRIAEVLAKGEKATQTYELKDTSKKFNSSSKYYTDAQIDFLKEELKDMLYFFGYANNSLSKDANFTGFFSYDKATDQEYLGSYMGHKAHTQNVIEWVSTLSPAMLEEFQYQLTDKSKEVNILDFGTTAEAGKAINDWSERQLYGKSYTNCK